MLEVRYYEGSSMYWSIQFSSNPHFLFSRFSQPNITLLSPLFRPQDPAGPDPIARHHVGMQRGMAAS